MGKRNAIPVMAILLTVLAAAAFLALRPRPQPVVAASPYVWSVDQDQLTTIRIALPRAGKSEAWAKHSDQWWYFAQPNGARVDMKRWGGGVPLLLSGPRSDRQMITSATDSELQTYGLSHPSMTISLELQSGTVLRLDLGDKAPDGQTYYIRNTASRQVYTVDTAWYSVLERLVLDPPWPAR